MRIGILAMGGNTAGTNIVDGYKHMRDTLYAIERVAESVHYPRTLSEKMTDGVLLALRDAGHDEACTTALVDELQRRFRGMVDPMLADVAEMARRGAEMDDWTECLDAETRSVVSASASVETNPFPEHPLQREEIDHATN